MAWRKAGFMASAAEIGKRAPQFCGSLDGQYCEDANRAINIILACVRRCSGLNSQTAGHLPRSKRITSSRTRTATTTSRANMRRSLN